ncbi:cytochrome c oxidase subunit 5B, mitochondrial-like [Ptychodera flava]|uniref:cytochrome c oxidase subunit 5B, mitochondrial-like n=1 Tax=Ptychodera flava TaxID=63121 RepID=UPI00396A6B3E
MASLISRTRVCSLLTRPFLVTSVRTMAKGGGVPLNEEHATGMEKLEMDMREAGLDDPFHLKPKHVAPGTKTSPTLVPSVFEKRIIGCICEEDATTINWMWLEKGSAQRCDCGHYFELTEGTPLQPVKRV